MTMRRIASFFALLLFLAAGSASAELAGGYNGLDDAAGMRLEFAVAGDRVEGVFVDQAGARRPFDADRLETGAETVIELNGQRVYMLFTEEPIGLSVISIPMTDADELITNQTQAMAFLADGVDTPPRPERYLPPPTGPGGVVAPQAFIESYAFWPSRSVGFGYQMLRGRSRTLIRLHAVVQTDIVWKLCRAGSAPAALADALRGQGVTCADVLRAFGRIMRPGGGAVGSFNAFRRDVEAQKSALVEAVRCSRDYRRSDPACKRAGARVAAAAVSMETVKSVLSRY